MSSLLLKWLNDDTGNARKIDQYHDQVYTKYLCLFIYSGLSEHIEGFSNGEFRDGYLIGEILFRYNQLDSFDKFVRNGTPQNILDNFRLLEPVMRKVGVAFNSKVAADIMKCNESVTKTTLYEMKICLESISRNSRTGTAPLLRGTRHDKVLNVVNSARPAYDQTRARTFQTAIRGALENTNAAMMSQVMKKYEDRTEDYLRTISMGESMDQETIILTRQRAKDIYHSRKEHEGEFSDAWEAINIDQWKKNQKIAHERRELKLRVTSKLQEIMEQKRESEKARTREETIKCIEEFDSKLETMIIKPEGGLSDSGMNLIKSYKFN